MSKQNSRVFLLISISLISLLVLAACSSGKIDKEVTADLKKPAETAGKTTDSSEKKPFEVQSESGSVKIYVGEEGSSGGELPEDYPEDLFPIFEDAFLYSTLELEGSFIITAFSQSKYKEVVLFYKEILKEANVTAETLEEDFLTSYGMIGEFSYSLDIGSSSEMEGYVTIISIMLSPIP